MTEFLTVQQELEMRKKDLTEAKEIYGWKIFEQEIMKKYLLKESCKKEPLPAWDNLSDGEQSLFANEYLEQEIKDINACLAMKLESKIVFR